MKKGYYIHFGGPKTSGVAKKIEMQIAELKRYYEVEEILVKDIYRSLSERIVGLLPHMSIEREYQEAFEKLQNPDFVYIRRAVADKKYYLFLSQIKKAYPKCKIIVEIFTYPYDKDEFAKWDAWPFYFKELIWRRFLKDAVDRFVTYSKDTEIFGVPCINTINGVDLNQISVTSPEKELDGIHLIAVANFQRSHGYERVIKGMRVYDQKKGPKVYLHLVGAGKEERKYQTLVSKWNMQEYVIFHGKKTGKELEKLYNRADITVGVFGLYKVGISDISSLKASEYLAKGLPVIGGCRENAFRGEAVSWYHEFSNDKSAVDIAEIVEFYKEVYSEDKEIVVQKIRHFAENTVAMEAVLLPVIKYIDGNV